MSAPFINPVVKKLYFLLLFVSPCLYGQPNPPDTCTRFIELVATVDWYGDARIVKANYPKDNLNASHNHINRRRIDELIKSQYDAKKHPIEIINDLADEGWLLVSATFVPGPERPAHDAFADKGKIIYYLKKRFAKTGAYTPT